MSYEFHELLQAAVSGLCAATAIINFGAAKAYSRAGDWKAATFRYYVATACLSVGPYAGLSRITGKPVEKREPTQLELDNG